MGLFSPRKSIRAIAKSLRGHQDDHDSEIQSSLPESHKTLPSLPNFAAPQVAVAHREQLLQEGIDSDSRIDTRRQTLYLRAADSQLEPSLAVYTQSQDLARRLEELAAAHRAGIIDDEAYRILRQTAFTIMTTSSAVPTPRPIGHVPSLDVPMTDPSLHSRSAATAHRSSSSNASVRSTRNFSSVMNRFRRSERFPSSPALSSTADSDRVTFSSRPGPSASPSEEGNAWSHNPERLHPPRTASVVSRSPSKHGTRTPPPSAFRFRSEDSIEESSPPPVPENFSTAAWMDDASAEVIRAELRRLRAEALRLDASFAEAQAAAQLDLERLNETSAVETSHEMPSRQPRQPIHLSEESLEKAQRHGRHLDLSIPSVMCESTPPQTRANEIATRRGEACDRYARKLEFLSARLLAAELRKKARF